MIKELIRRIKIRYYRFRIFRICKKIDKLNALLRQLETDRYTAMFEASKIIICRNCT